MAIFNNITDGGGTGNIDWGNIGGDLNNQTDLKNALNGKVDLDGSNADFGNLSATAKETITNLSAPSSRTIDISVTAGDTLYTAPANGYVGIKATVASSGGAIEIINNNNPNIGNGNSRSGTATILCCIPVAKGDVVKMHIYNCTSYSARFTYSIGN